MNKQKLFSNKEEIETLRNQIITTTNKKLKILWQKTEGIEFLKKIKFDRCGYDPLFEEPANFIEQTNQTFTYLVCLAATEYLLLIYPQQRFYVNFGTESGHDVLSEDGRIICECFAATAPDSNKKLEKDIAKVFENTNAEEKYVIYYVETNKPTHVENLKKKYPGVKLISLETFQ